MLDWFPREAKAKQKSNEREAAEEELRELGLDTGGCRVQ
jgi:carbamoylphosphate synthase large subunit